jgi:TatD DNase family protein
MALMNTIFSFIDSHLHLQDKGLWPDADGVIRRAQEAGVIEMFCNAVFPGDWKQVLDLAVRHGCVRPFIGVHPWEIENAGSGWMDELEAILMSQRCGVGEIGLDFVKPIDRAVQQEAFERQLALAVRYGRPVSLHCVKAWGALLAGLRKAGPLPAGFMVHAFNGSAETARELMRLGGYVSFNALSLTERRRDKTKELLTTLPEDRILVETESPFGVYLDTKMPDVSAERPNEPSNLPTVVREAALLTGKDMKVFSETLYANAKRFIGPLDEVCL